MKNVICILLSLVMILPLFCGCGKTYEEKKALAFEKAIKKNDQEAMNEYVEKYFEWSDLLNTDTIYTNSFISLEYLTFEKVYNVVSNADSGGCIIAKVCATSDFEQHKYSDSWFITPQVTVTEIFHSSSETSYINVGDKLSVSPSIGFIGIDKSGKYMLNSFAHESLHMLAPNHDYIVLLNCRKDADISKLHTGDFFAADIEKELEFLAPYQEKTNENLCNPLFYESALKFRQDMLEFCGVADKYPLPHNHQYEIFNESVQQGAETDSENNRLRMKMSDIIKVIDNKEGTPYFSKSEASNRYHFGYYWEVAMNQYAYIIISTQRTSDIPKDIKLSSEYRDQVYELWFTDRDSFNERLIPLTES